MKKRARNARQGRAGVIAVEQACNRLNLIWRNLLEEDVGVDGTIEIALGEFPTGKIVGAQIKSGMSYIRSETSTSFRFYPNSDDLAYWRGLSIPLILFVHHPGEDRVYWVDITHHVESRGDDPLGASCIEFSKSNQLDTEFETYLYGRFDLVVYSDEQYAQLRHELETLVHTDGSGGGTVSVSALDLFVEGLWGLCSKLQFHSSLLADIIRKSVRDREGAIPITYTFDRVVLYPFFSRYFSLLTRHHLALIDSADINNSLYAKLEYPAFIAVLTTNGRRFVEYLRSEGRENVHDNQFLSLTARPHVQIEVYSSFEQVGGARKFWSFHRCPRHPIQSLSRLLRDDAHLPLIAKGGTDRGRRSDGPLSRTVRVHRKPVRCRRKRQSLVPLSRHTAQPAYLLAGKLEPQPEWDAD